MHTASLLPVSPSMHCAWGVSAPRGVPGLGHVGSGGCLVPGGLGPGGRWGSGPGRGLVVGDLVPGDLVLEGCLL